MTGPDHAQFRVSGHEADNRIDEIEEYWNALYHASTEAIWRIMGYSVTKKNAFCNVTPHPSSQCDPQLKVRDTQGNRITLHPQEVLLSTRRFI